MLCSSWCDWRMAWRTRTETTMASRTEWTGVLFLPSSTTLCPDAQRCEVFGHVLWPQCMSFLLTSKWSRWDFSLGFGVKADCVGVQVDVLKTMFGLARSDSLNDFDGDGCKDGVEECYSVICLRRWPKVVDVVRHLNLLKKILGYCLLPHCTRTKMMMGMACPMMRMLARGVHKSLDTFRAFEEFAWNSKHF